MFDSYSHEHQASERQVAIVRRAEFLRMIHDAEMNEVVVPATGLRADLAALLRLAADRIDRPGTRPLLRMS